MAYLLDTSIAIPLRDGDAVVIDRVERRVASISVLTHVELEGGVYRSSGFMQKRRAGLDILLGQLDVIQFGAKEVAAYRNIVERIGYSRRNVVDRMIAATALVHDLTVITSNGRDFRDVPDLKLEVWELAGE